MNSDQTLKDYALDYAGKGWRLLPLWNKIPLISKRMCPKCLIFCENTAAEGQKEQWTCPKCKGPGGAGCKDATSDPQLIAAYWDKWPDAQIGVSTDGLLVVDIDDGDGKVGPESLEALEAEHGKLPPTLCQKTPRGGRHLIYRAPESTPVGNCVGCLGKDIDVRGNGGYLVFAPSMGANGVRYQWESGSDCTPIADAPDWVVEKMTEIAASRQKDARPPREAKVAEAFDTILATMRGTGVGQRNDTLFRQSLVVGQMIRAGDLPESAIDDLVDAAMDTGLLRDEAERTVESGVSAAMSKKPKRVVISEDRAADAFIAQYGDNVRFCHDSGWLEFSEDNHVWERGKTPSVMEKIRQVCRALNADGNAYFARASTYRGVAGIAQNDPKVFTKPEQWDAHPWLLSTPGGVVSLNGKPIECPERALHLTKTTRVAPAKGEPVKWLAFMNEVTQGDVKLQRYLWQVSGCALTGSTREHALFFVYGAGGNGKSVFLNTIENVLGDYAVRATMDVFTSSKSAFDKHTTDIAMLAGARLVSLSETEEGRSWKESLVKSMTGGDKQTARFMRRDNFTFQPQFKLVVVSNNKPRIAKVDDAMRRRINIIPFNFRPETPDLELERKLVAEYPQILNWMIEGCKDWLQNGFVKPQCVLDETAEYFAEQDLMAQWISENVEVAKEAVELGITLFNNWKEFMVSKGESERFLNVTRFGNEMKRVMGAHGVNKQHTELGNVYRGMRLKPDTESTPNRVQPLFPARRS